MPKQKQGKIDKQKEEENEMKKMKVAGITSKFFYTFKMPSFVGMIMTIALISTALVLPLIGKGPKKTISSIKKMLGDSLPLFDLDELNLEDVYYYLTLSDRVNFTAKLPDLELQDLNIKEQPISNLYYLTMLAEKYELDLDDFVNETTKFYKDYAFIDDLEMDEENLEGTVIKKAKPQSVEACYYAVQIMKKTGEFKKFVGTEEYAKMIKFVLKMQATSGLLYNNKNTETDMKILKYAIELLSEAKRYDLFQKDVSSALDRIKVVYDVTLNLDGSYDFYLEDNPSCFGTAYGVLGRKLLGLSIEDTTRQYLTSCVTEKGALIYRDEKETDVETGLAIDLALSGLTEIQGSTKEGVSTVSCVFIGVAVISFLSNSVDTNTLKEVIITYSIFILGNVVSYVFREKTLQLFLVVPTLISLVKSIQRVESWKKHAMFWLITLTPASVIGCVTYLIDAFFPALIVSMSAEYLVFFVLAVVMYFSQIVCYQLFGEKHKNMWYIDASQIAFHFAFIVAALMLGASDNIDFVFSTMQLTGSTSYFLVGVPCIGYALALAANIFSVPAVSIATQILAKSE
ncbi:hypothetical protein EIN_252340 [Entamoeba invadens IP1]|uniref:Uncharacterized protein n=1 Tax=Entamoeba invadens IP1 TaxID=370355 RepID=A0A0A1UEN5_ENTIV|nr:hypothetical protein EIN_252340 [Entamoeba invadens IP1]ELP95020.1 hypothetical protein EIN_252340 [Entamoeba invadens IP1]|eukprot:XP_004261791.1 hypothetical protein EIN_252340 [Entamoeba invadens IP1]